MRHIKYIFIFFVATLTANTVFAQINYYIYHVDQGETADCGYIYDDIFAFAWYEQGLFSNSSFGTPISGNDTAVVGIAPDKSGPFIFTSLHFDNDFAQYDYAGIAKHDSSGTVLWAHLWDINNDGWPNLIKVSVEGMINGDVVAAYYIEDELRLRKLSGDGNLMWDIVVDTVQGMYETPTSNLIAENINGNILVMAAAKNAHPYYEINSDGSNVTKHGFFNNSAPMPGVHILNQAINVSQSGNVYLLASYRNANPGGDSRLIIRKYAANGDSLWTSEAFVFPTATDILNIADFTLDAQEHLFITYGRNADPWLMTMDSSGNILFNKNVFQSPVTLEYPVTIDLLPKGKLGICGHGYVPGFDVSFTLVIDTSGTTYSNHITGNLRYDENGDCIVDSTENPFKNIYVSAEGKHHTYYGITDSTGWYDIAVPKDSFIVRTHPPNPLLYPCVDSIAIIIDSNTTSVQQDFAIDGTICPWLTVDVSTNRLIRCFDNTYAVSYCNTGLDTAYNAYMEIHFDTFLEVLSSTPISWTTKQGQLFTFDLGNIAPGECGGFYVAVKVDCDSAELGQTHCVTAHIYPDTLCLPPNTSWSGASLQVSGQCIGDSVLFTIQNVGQGDMTTPVNYIVIEDDIVMMQSPVILNQGALEQITIPADAGYYRMNVMQVPDHPGWSNPTASVQGCNGTPVSGFWLMYPEDDNNPFVDIDCQENVGSYDPNDKQGFPAGYDIRHYIEANTPIEYKIRFQNTGTAPAQKVVIVDLLPSGLNPVTLQPGASSHPYTFRLLTGNIAEFIFDNINLPDSASNEPASHGFVKFTIDQYPDLPIGTEIINEAGIYFDFNAPVITNSTLHTIGKDFLSVIFDPANPNNSIIKAYPNPASDYVIFEIETSAIYESRTFELYNAQGQLLRSAKFSGTQYRFERNALSKGFYFFRMVQNNTIIGSGKIVISEE